MGRSYVPTRQLRPPSPSATPPREWGRVIGAPSPAFGGYFPMNGEELFVHLPAPSPAFDGYFPMNGEELFVHLPAPSPAFGGYFPMNGEELFFCPSHEWGRVAPPCLLDGDAFGEVARLVDVLAELGRDVIREQLEHDRVQDR